jgi:tetratricopeptide (TPR) repeat protein
VAEERCARALHAATASLASELTARLDRSHTYRVTLFRATGHPALQAGNDLAVAARWEAALEQYGKAVTASGEQLDGKEPRAHAHYASSLALSELGRYTEALAALKQAQLLRPDPRYLPPLQQLQLSAQPTFAQEPPAQPRRAKASKKGRKKKVIQGLRRTVIYR